MTRLLTIVLAAVLAACSDNNGTQLTGQPTPPVTPPSTVVLPIADAGHPMALRQGATAVLNGSGSYDPGGAAITYQWSIISAPPTSTSTLVNPTSPYPSLYLDVIGDYQLGLIVNNGADDSVQDVVTISDSDSIPVANAGADIRITGAGSITLDGSGSFDSDGNPLAYRWQITSAPTGSNAVLARENTPFAVLTPDTEGTYEVELIVNDGNNDSQPDTVVVSDQNLPPFADAGLGTTFTLGTPVVLDGSGSYDPDGDRITYQWRMVSRPQGSTAVIVNDQSLHSEITPDVNGDFVISLVVSDGLSDSAVSTVTLHRDNHPPIANPGFDQSANIGDSVQLDGTGSSDADGDFLIARWSLISKPAASAVQLFDSSTMHPYFTPDADGIYLIQLVVSDGTFQSVPMTVVVSTGSPYPSSPTPAPSQPITGIVDLRPIAQAGNAQSVSVGQIVHLDGAGSYDPEGSGLTYEWSIVSAPAGSAATLSGTTLVSPDITPDVAGSYLIQLVVSDGVSKSTPSTVLITDINLPPVADAGLDQSVGSGNLVQLNGSGSSDPEGGGISYQWSFISFPAGSNATLSSSTTAATSFTADVAGDYVLQLMVTDAYGLSASDLVVVRDSFSQTNTLPVANAGIDRLVDLGNEVSLDGTGSSDADGDMLTYRWVFISRPTGSAAQLSDTSSDSPRFTPDVDGDYVFQLVVSDSKSTSLPDTVVIHRTLKNLPPIAVISSPPSGVTGQLYTGLDGASSSDPNGDVLTYRWTFTPPGASAATISDTTATSPVFTPDVSGNYLVTLVVNDGRLDSSVAVQVVTVSDPPPGSALPLQPGHNLMALSTLGGSQNVGAIYSVQESNLASITDVIEHGGTPSFVSDNKDQSLTVHPNNRKLYTLIDDTGLYGNGAVIEFDPVTNTSTHFTSIPRMTVAGNNVDTFRTKLLFHPNGLSAYAYSIDGGENDAGVIIHINFDPADKEYRKVTVINEYGKPVTNYNGTSLGLVTDLIWSDDYRLLAMFGFSLHGAAPPSLEFTASDTSDLTQPWTTSVFDDGMWSRGRFIAYSQPQDTLMYTTLISPPIIELSVRQGGGGFNISDCRDPMGVFEWQLPQLFIYCEKSSNSSYPTLLSTNYAGAKPVYEKGFSNLPERDSVGLSTSPSIDTLFITLNDEIAGSLVIAPIPGLSNLPVKNPAVYEVRPPNYAAAIAIQGGGDRGILFVGDSAVLHDPMAPVGDQYLSQLSFDGGTYGEGAILTRDKVTGSVSMLDFGFDKGGFPFGRIHKSSTDGAYYFSVSSAVGQILNGTTVRYDPTFGTLAVFDSPQDIRTGIGVIEHTGPKGTRLYGLGHNSYSRAYEVYAYDMVTGQYESIVDLSNTNEPFPQYELVEDSGNLWALTETALFCIDPDAATTNARIKGFSAFIQGFARDPVRAPIFPIAGAPGYLLTRESSTPGHGTIVVIQNDGANAATSCSNAATVTLGAVSLADLPSTGFVANPQTQTDLYFGTDNGQLMRFDTTTVTVSNEASLRAGYQFKGFMIIDQEQDIVGFAVDPATGDEYMFSYDLVNGGAPSYQLLPADKPIDPIYPGFTEIN